MLVPAIGAEPRPAGALWLWVRGWTVSHLRAGVGVVLGLGLCCGSGCCSSSSLGLGFDCWCHWRFSGSPSCVVPACCEASRSPPSCLAVSSHSSFLTSWACAASPTLALASTCVGMSMMPVPHCRLSWWRSSHIFSQSCSHSFMLSQCLSSLTTCASSILAILSTVWCSSNPSCASCLIVPSRRPLQSPGALADSEVTLLSLIQFFLHSYCSLASMKDTRVVFLVIAPTTPPASSASAMSISLWIGGFSIIPLRQLWPSSFAIVAGFVVMASHRTHLASFDRPEWTGDVVWGSVRCSRSNACVHMLLPVEVAEWFRSFCFVIFARTFALQQSHGGSVCYTATYCTELFPNWVTNRQSFQYVFVFHLTNMHAMSHRFVIFLACSSRVNI